MQYDLSKYLQHDLLFCVVQSVVLCSTICSFVQYDLQFRVVRIVVYVQSSVVFLQCNNKTSPFFTPTVHTHIHMCKCTHAHTYVHTYMYTHMHIHTRIHAHIIVITQADCLKCSYAQSSKAIAPSAEGKHLANYKLPMLQLSNIALWQAKIRSSQISLS